MYNEKISGVSEQLSDAAEKLATARKLRRSLEMAEKSLAEEQARVEKLYNQLTKEKGDIDKLEGLSLTALFYTVLGNKEKQMDKERQEYLAVKLKYDEAREAAQSLKIVIDNYKVELKHLGDPEYEYESLLKEKERLLLEFNGPEANRLFEISEQEAKLFQWNKELREALQAGQEVLRALEKVQEELQSACNWGAWDMLGGGLLATAVKHSKIDNARTFVHQAQQKMRYFQRELADVRQCSEIVIDMDGLTRFADYFFDGLIVDWIVQSKIRESLEQTNSQLTYIDNILHGLRQQLVETDNDMAQLKIKKTVLIERA